MFSAVLTNYQYGRFLEEALRAGLPALILDPKGDMTNLLLTFPELAICGYPPEDLLFKPQFIAENLKSLDKIIAASQGLALVVGFVDADGDAHASSIWELYDSATLAAGN